MAFPLLRLPQLAIIEIVRSLESIELFVFSVSSPKYTQLYTRSIPVRLDVLYKDFSLSVTFQVGVNPESKSTIHMKTGPASSSATIWNIYDGHIPVVNYPTHLDAFLPPHQEFTVVQSFIGHFTQYFKMRTFSLELTGYNDRGCVHVLQYANDLNLKFEKIIWAPSASDDYKERRALALCANASELKFELKFTCGFVFYSFGNFTVDNLYIEDSCWVTVENLCDMMMGCLKVELASYMQTSNRLSSERLNQFLKRWMKGGRLEWLRIMRYDGFDMKLILDGIDSKEIEKAFKYEVQRPDGTKAMLSVYGHFFSLSVVKE